MKDSKEFSDLRVGDIIDSVRLCASVTDRGKDIWEGDSSGPVFDQEGTQVGVVSWGYKCARDN
jgi:secreted trypsin-like serine protease